MLFIIIINLATKGYISWRESLSAIPAPAIDFPQLNIKTANLLYKPYAVSSTPFAGSNYEEAPRIVYRGPFSEIRLTATGTLSSQERFFIFSFNNDTGILDGIRTASNKIIPSEKKRAKIDANGHFSITIDLLDEKLGTSSKYFEAVKTGSKDFHFIPKNSPADSAKILLAPFNNNGEYGGMINSMAVEYSCAGEDLKCKVELCLPNEKTTACIARSLSGKEASEWRQRTGL